MGGLVHSPIGLVHLVASVSALFFGTLVLVLPKRSQPHKRAGYAYVLSMVLVLTSAFGIYQLFHAFGVVHAFAVVSGLTLLAGMVPVLTRKPAGRWPEVHFTFMYWSVMEVYGALAAETVIRIPHASFSGMVGAAGLLVLITGGVFFGRHRKQWQRMFGRVRAVNPPRSGQRSASR